MVLRLFGFTTAVCLQICMANDVDRSRMQLLRSGDTLSECQTFRWRSPLRTARVQLAVGSCPGCEDIASRQETNVFSSTIALPSDGRDIHVSLTTIVDGVVVGVDEQLYRAASASNGNTRAQGCDSKPDTTIGIYHWSGEAARSMAQGVQTIADMGGSAVRLTLSARARRDYNMDSRCIEAFRLPDFLSDADVRQALASDSIRTYMLTAFDGVSFSDCERQLFLSPRFYSPENRARLVREYSDFAYELIRTHAGSRKAFIVSNWESDNVVYCGNSFSYTTSPEFRKNCDADYPLHYSGNSGPEESLEGLRNWFTVRWEGIADGRRRAVAQGFASATVSVAPEINSVRDLRDTGLPSVLTHVLPYVQFDYVSYSSWESLNRAGTREELAMDLDTIRATARTDAVVIGEIGYAMGQFGGAAVERTRGAMASVAKWGVQYVFHWVLYDDASATGFGLYDVNGALTPIGNYFKTGGFRVSGD